MQIGVYSRLSLLDTLSGGGGGRRDSREKKNLFCLETYEIICNNAKIKFLTWLHEPENDLSVTRNSYISVISLCVSPGGTASCL